MRCKFNRKLQCQENNCDERCKIFRNMQQQTLAPFKPKVVKRKASKGVITEYHRVEK